jgi:protein ImuA
MSRFEQRIVKHRKSGQQAITLPDLRLPDLRLPDLRRRIAQIERHLSVLKDTRPLSSWSLGLPVTDEHLPRQGLALNGLHDIAPAVYSDTPSAMGFALCLAIRRLDLDVPPRRPLLWCRLSRSVKEWGRLYGHGLFAFGLPRERFLTLSVKKPASLLWTVEEALRSGTLSAVVAEVDSRALDLTLTRRLSLAAEAGSTPALLVLSHSIIGATAALSRWQVKACASTPPPLDAHAPGVPAWNIALERCRGGRPGEWSVEWSHATHRFSLVASVSGGTAEPHSAARWSFPPEHARSGLRIG